MAGQGVSKEIRRRLYAFSDKIASSFTDSRRSRFVKEMIRGTVLSGHTHLTKIARAVGRGDEDVHAEEKRLSRNLGSEHWDMSPVADELLHRSAAMITDDSVIAVDLTDLAKIHARHLEGLGTVPDGSDRDKRLVSGYMVFEAYVRVGKWQLFPLIVEPLETYSKTPISENRQILEPTNENREILKHTLRIHQAAQGKGTYVFDRGFDRIELFLPWLNKEMAFVVRQRGDRHVITVEGKQLSVKEAAGEMKLQVWPKELTNGYTASRLVRLPANPEYELLLVVHWQTEHGEPLMLLVSPTARRPGRHAEWYVKAHRQRWGVEDATRGVKQQFQLEAFLVRSWVAIRRLLCLVAWAFYWLNLWGADSYERLRDALIHHKWRLSKTVKYLFNWIATQIRHLLHPRPRFTFADHDTG